MANTKTQKTENDIDLFGNEIPAPREGIKEGTKVGRNKTGGYINNPLIPLYGITANEKCKTCVHIVRKHYSKVYIKCAMRGNVDKTSVVSDHKVNWPACGKWEREVVTNG